MPATLVIGYHTAVQILNDPEHFPADPRMWESNIPADCPVRPMMEWRPNSLRSSGGEHTRYRSATSAALDQVDLHHLHATVERISVPLINSFCEEGACDVVSQYAYPLVLAGRAAIFDTVDAAAGSVMLTDDHFAGGMLGGSLSTRDALDEVLFSDPRWPTIASATRANRS